MKKYYRVCTVLSDYWDRPKARIDRVVCAESTPEPFVCASDMSEWDYDWFASRREAKAYIRQVTA